MSNYTKTTDFEAKDSLPSGDSGKIIKGAEFETEFDNIATAVATKADTAGPTFTGTVTYATLNDGTTALTSTVAELNILDGVTSTAAELNILDGVTSTAAELNILDGVTSTAAELNILDGVTSTAAELNILDGVTSTAAELNTLDGVTAVVGELNALDLGSTAIGTAVASKAVVLDANKDYTGVRNLTLTGDLTIGGDDLTMGTNTAGHLLIADGTNFNPVAVGSLSEISTVADDDVLLAVDTSGGGLKKITRSTVVSGLATSTGISNVSEDSTPQLGGNLDLNGSDIVTTSNATLDLAPNGTGTVVVRGNTNSGAIVFNCESNSHGQKVYAQPHSAAVTNTLMLPAGANSTLVSLVSTDTLTNKTLTSPKINEDVAVTSTATEINLLDGVTATTAELNILDGVTSTAAELNILDGVTSTAAELNILDGVTSTAAELNALDGITAVVGELNALDLGATAVGTAIASKAVILDSNKDYTGLRNFTITGELDAATLDISGDADIDGTLETDALSINGTAVTSTAAELNKLDGVGTLKQAGLETIYVPAAAMYPNTTAGCAALAQVELSNGPELKCLDFDASSDENAQFTVAFPKSWNEGTVTFQVFFTVTGTNTGTVAWGLSGVSFADNASINTAFGTNVVATAKAHSGTSNDINVTAVSGAVTIANAAVDTQTYFQIMRDVSADNQSGDARLLGIKLFFTTDAANDA